MNFVLHDGGRAAAGYKGTTGDCVTRSIAIVTGRPYQEVYDALNELGRNERISKRKKKRSNSRTGVYRKSYQRYLESLGWQWTPTMAIGSGCTVHLRADELPKGRLLVKSLGASYRCHRRRLARHPRCSRRGTRCVYGYFSKP